MLGRQELEHLRMRKQALVLESEMNRQTLRDEWENLRASTAWMGKVTQTTRQASPLLMLLLAPLGGFLAARALRKQEGAVARLLSLWKWVQPAWVLWKKFSAKPAADEPGP